MNENLSDEYMWRKETCTKLGARLSNVFNRTKLWANIHFQSYWNNSDPNSSTSTDLNLLGELAMAVADDSELLVFRSRRQKILLLTPTYNEEWTAPEIDRLFD